MAQMEIKNNNDTEAMLAMPSGPFLARHYSTTGPLCIVAMSSGMGTYNVMFLDGNGGPAWGDVWTGVKEEKIRAQFLPLQHSVTLKNVWR